MRQLVFLTLVLWLMGSLGLGTLFFLTPYAALATAIQQPNYAAEYPAGPSVFTPERYEVLRVGLLAVAGLSAMSLIGLARSRRGARRGRLRAEWLRTLQSLLVPWQRLHRSQRIVGLALGGAALLVRAWLVAKYPITTDELTSYDYYVRPGLAVTASSYSLPNNHLLYNLLVGSLPGLGLPADVQQRLPAISVGIILLPVSYLLLLRHLRFAAATLALGLFTFAPMPAFYSIAGRGYGLQLAASLAGIFATLALLRAGGGHRLPWLVFVVAGVAGLYTVPTHVYVLVVLGVALLVGFGRQAGRQRWLRLSYLLGATLSIATTVGLLYAPVGAVTGWAALLRNPYVHSLSWAEFRHGFYNPYLLGVASQLWGQARLSLLLLGGLALGAGLLLRRAQRPARALGWLSYGLVYGPLLLLLVQRVYVPARALLLVMLCSFVLLALLLQELLKRWRPLLERRWPWRWRGAYMGLLLLLIGVCGGYRLHREAGAMRAIAVQQEYLARQHAWLWARQPARVWVDSLSRPYQGIYWYHLGLQKHQPLPLVVTKNLPLVATGGGREYAVFYRDGGLAPPPTLLAQPPAYVDKRIYIWQLPSQTKIQ